MATYFSLDIETDGPCPGKHSMMSFAFVAYTETGNEVGTFKRTLNALPNSVQDKDTMEWWATKPEAYKWATQNAIDPGIAIVEACQWIKQVGIDRPIQICFPSAFDNTYWRYYAMHYNETDPFMFNVIDGSSYAMGKFSITRREASLRNLYKRFLTEEETKGHTHDALSDARTQGLLFLRMQR